MKVFLLSLSILFSACGVEGLPPAGQVPGSPSTGGFIPKD